MRQNGFWLGLLRRHYEHGLDLGDIERYEELLALLTPERLRAAAERYLSTERYVLGVLEPEAADGGAEAAAAGAR